MTNRIRPVYVIGTGLSHDGSACLLKDGRIKVAIEKERLTRYKHDGFNDTTAIQYCLEAEGIGLSDVSLIVQNANFGMFEYGSEWYRGARLITNDMPLVTISHHLAHAYSAFGPSRFDDAAVLVIDGCGSGLDECVDIQDTTVIPERPEGELASLWFEKDSYYNVKGSDVRALYKDFSPMGVSLKGYPLHPVTTRHSIGGLYAAVSNYIFRGMDDSGKLMGLAPYGRPNMFEFDAFELRDGRAFVLYDWMKQFRSPARSDDAIKKHFQHYADLAYWIQRQVEDAVLYIVRSRYDLYPSRNLCYAGGVALNAVANARILKESPFENVYFQPAAGDNGLAIGCAYYGWLAVLQRERIIHDGSTCFGRTYESSEVEEALTKQAGGAVRVAQPADYVAQTVTQLMDGKVVGWFQGGSEFGPRALGNRSILADPRIPTMREYINAEVKFREDFRPFAPSVLREDVGLYFECDCDSPYMLCVARVRPEWRERIPSVVHLDHTARIQTVTEELNPLYYRLLCEFKRRTGLGILLNTSFNRRRMPIVENPEDAIAFFLASGINVLVINQFVVEKSSGVKSGSISLTAFFQDSIRSSLERRLSEALKVGGIYQFNINSIVSWTIDLSAGRVDVIEGRPNRKADVLIESNDADLRAMCETSTAAFRLLQEGRVKVVGDQERAYQLAEIIQSH